MNMRCAIACLAVLAACGSNESEPSAASKSSTSKNEPAAKPAEVYKAPAEPAKPKPPTETAKAPEASKPKPPPESDLLADAEPKKPAPPADTAPGIVITPPQDAAPPSAPSDMDMTDPAGAIETPAAVERAVAHVTSSSGSAVTGTVTFTRQATGVEVHVQLEGLTPGMHGLHVHETGDCSAADALTAGDHFNPTNAPHAARDAMQRHVGDLGNVEADAAGRVDVTFTDRLLALSGEASILGRALIVHADADDFTSQPAGNSGARIACGVIEEQKVEASKLPGG